VIHETASAHAGRTVMWGENEYVVEDWWDRVSGQSWAWAKGNPACIQYAMRTCATRIPDDDEVLYGKVNGLGHLVHVSELGEVVR